MFYFLSTFKYISYVIFKSFVLCFMSYKSSKTLYSLYETVVYKGSMMLLSLCKIMIIYKDLKMLLSLYDTMTIYKGLNVVMT